MKQEHEITQLADGIRFNWNVFPSTRLEASQLSAPIGCLYTPLHQRTHQLQPIPEVTTNGPPVSCDSCGNYINPYIKIDRANRMWYCPYCEEKNFFPSYWNLPSPDEAIDAWPTELQPASSTVEYVLPPDSQVQNSYNLAYVFVVDTYQHMDESEEKVSSFDSLKERVCDAISKLPDGAMVSVVTYDEYVFVHKPQLETFVALTTHDLFPVDKETNRIVHKNVKLFDETAPLKLLHKLGQTTDVFVELSSSTRSQLTTYVSELGAKLTTSYKPARATGLATYVVSAILRNTGLQGLLGRVLLFSGGPCTLFPGNIIDMEKDGKKTLRSHKDIADLSAPQFLTASKFYKTLALVASGLSFKDANTVITTSSKKETDFPVDINAPRWSFDLISGSLDQVGIYETKSLASHTMGNIHIYETFNSTQFAHDLDNIVHTDLHSKYLSTLTVNTSTNLKVSRMVGCGHNLPSSYQNEKYSDKHHEKISDHLTQFDSSSKKTNFTNQWSFQKLHKTSTMVVLFEPEVARSSNELQLDGITKMYVQFQLKYWDLAAKCWKLRVTNIEKKTTLYYLAANKVKMSNNTYKLVNTKSSIIKEKELLGSFDQEAFIVILARLLLDKTDTIIGYEHFSTVASDVDKILIKLLYHWGGISVVSNYTSSNPYSNLLGEIVQKYELNENFKRLPSLAYNLRRNPQLVQIFNSSPDETAFNHHWFMSFDCATSVTALQPRLYEIGETVTEVTLDSQNVVDSKAPFLMMDSVYNVVLYKTDESLKLHHSKNSHLVYDKDKSISHALSFIEDSVSRRPLLPKYVVTQKNHSQSRFLLSRLNPLETLEDDFEQVSVETHRDSFFDKVFGSKRKRKSSYNQLFTDDISLNRYYKGLVESVKKYTIEDDY